MNNAGILRDKSFAKMSLDDFRLVLDVHLMGSVICTKAVWDCMREQRYGRIVMTTSSSGLYGNFGQANYGAAKMALVGLMQTLAIEGEKYGIRVNCLAPSAATQMTQGVLPDASLEVAVSCTREPCPAWARVRRCAESGDRLRRRRPRRSRERHALAGVLCGGGDDADERAIEQWPEISDRANEIVPAYGFVQAEREVASAQEAR